MQYAQLGRTGVFVSRICLGAMTFGGPDSPVTSAIGRLSQDETDAIVGQALDAGGQLYRHSRRLRRRCLRDATRRRP